MADEKEVLAKLLKVIKKVSEAIETAAKNGYGVLAKALFQVLQDVRKPLQTTSQKSVTVFTTGNFATGLRKTDAGGAETVRMARMKLEIVDAYIERTGSLLQKKGL